MSVSKSREYLNFTQETNPPPGNIQPLHYLHQVAMLFSPGTVKIGTMYNSMLRNFSNKAIPTFVPPVVSNLETPQVTNQEFLTQEESVQDLLQLKSIEGALNTELGNLARLKAESGLASQIKIKESEVAQLQEDHDQILDRLRASGYRF